MSGANIFGFTPLLDEFSVCALLRISPRELTNLVKNGRFPPPVRLGKHVWWSSKTVQCWHQQLFGTQEAWHVNIPGALADEDHPYDGGYANGCSNQI